MTDHQITPPPELVQQWALMIEQHTDTEVFTIAAQWGADQELEACCEWIDSFQNNFVHAHDLRLVRRPKTPSLKEQAVFAAAVLRSPDETCSIAEIEQHWHTIRRTLESLPD
jgi:hypothetical protein